MKKRNVAIILCILGLFVSAITITKNTSSKEGTSRKVVHSSSSLPQALSRKNITVPDHVVYGFLLMRVASINKETQLLQAQRRIRQTSYLALQHEAALTREQAIELSEIASVCEEKVRHQDERANAIIGAFRKQLAESTPTAEGLPPTPPELKTMWDERNAIILQHRDRLREAFGEEAFIRFNNFAKSRYGTNDAPVSLNPIRPVAD